jgi:hypothetical protein
MIYPVISCLYPHCCCEKHRLNLVVFPASCLVVYFAHYLSDGSHIGGFIQIIGDPQVTMGFNTKSWSSMTWMIWRYPHDLGNHPMVENPSIFMVHDMVYLRFIYFFCS